MPEGVSLSPLLKPKVGVAKGPVFFSCTTFYWQLIQFHFFSVSELHIEVEIFRSCTWCLCTVTFGSKSSKLNSRPVLMTLRYLFCTIFTSHNLVVLTADASRYLMKIGWKLGHLRIVQTMSFRFFHKIFFNYNMYVL